MIFRRQIVLDLQKQSTASLEQQTKLQNRTNVLRRKILAWIQIQHLYMPGVHQYRQDDDVTDVLVHEIDLYLPSSVLRQELEVNCDDRLFRFEFELRQAQADDALQDTRNLLQLRSHAAQDKRRFQQGQRNNTRALGVIARLTEKINFAASKYRLARNAIILLGPKVGANEENMKFPPLEEKDVRPIIDDSETVHAKEQELRTPLQKAAGGNIKRKQDVSWIWSHYGKESESDGDKLLREGTWCVYSSDDAQ